MEEQQNADDKDFDMKIYEENLERAKRIAQNQEKKGITLSTDNVISIATTMFITAQQKMQRSKRY